MPRLLAISPEVEATARQTVDAVFRVHATLGPGLLESCYSACLQHELKTRGLACATEVPIGLQYGSTRIEVGFRADLIIRGHLLVETKAVDALVPVHVAQFITYLKLTGLPLGLLVNFNVPLIRNGIRRVFDPDLP